MAEASRIRQDRWLHESSIQRSTDPIELIGRHLDESGAHSTRLDSSATTWQHEPTENEKSSHVSDWQRKKRERKRKKKDNRQTKKEQKQLEGRNQTHDETMIMVNGED